MVQLPILLAETALVNRKSLARLSDINLRALRKCFWPSRRGMGLRTWRDLAVHEWDGALPC